MKEETKQILEIITTIQESMVTDDKLNKLESRLNRRINDLETTISAEMYTATRAMRDDIVELYNEDVELDNKVQSNHIDLKSGFRNILNKIKNIETHIGLKTSV